MPEFLAETYTPRGAPDIAAVAAGDITPATDQVSEETAAVRLLGAIVVPDEETCFYLYQAPSADAVLEAMTRARLQPGRITQAMSIGWAAAVPAAAGRPLPEDM
jgi:hypothetical protein